MESIGTILRHERERRGLSVQEVFESTKITVLNVEALELDRFESFPNKVYARAFLRDYANFLDIDSGALLQRYESEWFVIPVVEVQPAPVKRKNTMAWTMVAVLIIAIIGGVYVWLTYYSEDMTIGDIASSIRGVFSSDTNESNNTLDSVVPPLPPNTKALPDAIPDVTPMKPVPPPVSIPTVVPIKPAVTGLVLTVSALKQNVWIGVTGDGDKQLFQQELKPGESKSWNAKHKFKIRCGRLHAIQVRLNGVTVKLKPDPKNHTSGGAVFGLKDVQPVPEATLPKSP